MKLGRRDFLRLLLAGAGTAALAACGAPRARQRTIASGTPRAAQTGFDAAAGGRATFPAQAATGTPAPGALALATGAPAATEVVEPTATAARAALPGDTPGADGHGPAPLARDAATATPRPPTATPVPTATTRPALGGSRRMWTWLRMTPTGDVPSSEADYVAHADTIDAALPLNGGKLQGDGTWAQEDYKLRPGWPAGLKARAHAANQLYMPGMGNDANGLLAVLDNPGRHAKVAADLAGLAQGRADAPWDGVFLDLEAIPGEYRDRMSRLLVALARAVKDAGLLLGISVGGTTDGSKPITDPAYDLGVVRDLADFVDLRCYDYYGQPRGIGPYWWIEGVVQYALAGGIPARKVILGQANYSRFWSDGNAGAGNEMTYNQAMALVKQNNARLDWIESEARGPVRERVAQIGGGRLVVHDGDTYAAGLGLIQQYNLLGSMVFAPGMGDDRYWQAIRNWRATYGVA